MALSVTFGHPVVNHKPAVSGGAGNRGTRGTRGSRRTSRSKYIYHVMPYGHVTSHHETPAATEQIVLSDVRDEGGRTPTAGEN